MLYLLFLAALTLSTASAAAGADDVLILDSSNFDSTVSENEITLVEFFAPWCGHCKKLAPEYAKAATQLKGEVALASVDCTVEKALCSEYGVRGFPTLKIFRSDGTNSDYQGGRTEVTIVKFMKKQNKPAFIHVSDAADLEKHLENDVAVVAFVADAESDDAKAYIAAASALRNDYDFAIVTDASLHEDATFPSVVVFKNFDDGKSVHTGEMEKDAISTFVVSESFPLVGEIGPDTFQKYVDRGFPLVWCFVDFKDAATEDLLAEVAKVAADFKDSLSFVKLDGVRWVDHAKHFGLSGKTPGIVLEDRETSKNYVFDESKTISVENLKPFAESYVSGDLQPTLKSEDVPENNDGPVTTLVGTTFEEIVFDDTKDVLVEFYAPWCGHCKSLAPKYEKLGEMFGDDDSVIIAKIDATANDAPAKIKGFPTILFYPADNKDSPMTYSGAREADDMAEYIKSHGTAPESESSTSHDEL